MLSNEKIKRLLSDFLSDREIKVYLTSLRSGPLSVQDLAKKAGINRVICYQILDSLSDKGLIVQELKKFGRHIIAENPQSILKIIDRRKRRLRHRELDIREVMPELLAFYRTDNIKPKVKFYEGKSAYSTICEDTLNSGAKEILQIGNIKNIYQAISKTYDDEYYIPARMENKIKARILTFESPLTKKFQKKDNNCLRETKFLPDKFLFQGYKFVYQNKIAIISSAQELIGLIIESENLVQMERQIFEILWLQNK